MIVYGDHFRKPERSLIDGHEIIVYGHVYTPESFALEEASLGADNDEINMGVALLEMWIGRGQAYSMCFSTVVPEGEVGLVNLEDAEKITYAEFVAARAAGWPER